MTTRRPTSTWCCSTSGGDEVDLDEATGPSYDRSGAKGSGVATAEIEDTGDYILTASSDDPEVMVRVGRDPSNGVTALRLGAVAVLVAGIALFVVGMARGGRRPAPVAGQPGYAAVAAHSSAGAAGRAAIRQPARCSAVRDAASTAAAATVRSTWRAVARTRATTPAPDGAVTTAGA